MALYSIEVVTIVAAVTIGTILAVYVIVLRLNGWLGRGAKFYRCPNRQCNRIFQKPVELKDLSETPQRTYRACPHCGTDLEPLLTSDIKHKLRGKGIEVSHKKNAEVEIGDSALNIETKEPETESRMEDRGKKAVKPIVAQKVQTFAENKKKASKTHGVSVAKSTPELKEQQDPIPRTQQESDMPEKTLGEGAAHTETEFSAPPDGCTHFFGYLRCLPKGSAVPYSCYSCPKMVDCYMH